MTDVKKVATGKMAGKGFILGGLAIITMGLVMYIFLHPPLGRSSGLVIWAVVMGLLMMCMGLYYYVKERDRPVADERSMRVFAQAGNITWFLMWLLLGALAALAAIGTLPVSIELIVWAVWIAMPWVFLILRFVIGRRGEVV